MQTLKQALKTDPSLHLWTREEYYRMGDAGLFQDKRVQLIEGQIVEMSPMKSPHATGINLVVAALSSLVSDLNAHLGIQLPLTLSEISEPEPDVAIVAGSIRDYAQNHPTTAMLAVEVSESTLRFDRLTKGSLYARADLPDYWILNVVDRCLEVYRSPVKDPRGSYGFQYAEKAVYQPGDAVSLLVLPEKTIEVADLIP